MIKVIYNKVCGRCVQSEPLTSGMVGQTIHFEYSHDFDGLAVTAVFTDGKNTVDVVNPGNECVIPHEVLTTVGAMVKVGIYATKGNELVIPTIYATIGAVLKGADPSGDVSIDPTLPVWAQIQALMGNLSDLNTEAKNNLVSAINEAAQTGSGGASIAMRVEGGYIQYSTDNGKTWVNLIAEADLKGDKGDPGSPGKDGHSPVVTATKSGKTTTISVDGTAIATVEDGTDGAPGVAGTPGKDGTSITISGINESTADGGTNTVTFSDGSALKVKNGSKGSTGADGKDGAPGVYYGTTQPTGDTHPVWLDPDGNHDDGGLLPAVTAADNGKVLRVVSSAWAADMPTGGTDMGITGATVGQIAKITAVDDTGKPTAWSPVDMPTGGGGSAETFELIKYIKTTEAVNEIRINADDIGEPFELKELQIYTQLYLQNDTSAAISIKLHSSTNGSTANYDWPFIALSPNTKSNTAAQYPAAYAGHFKPKDYTIDNKKYWVADTWSGSAIGAGHAAGAVNRLDFLKNSVYETHVMDAVRCVMINANNGAVQIGANSEIWILGKRGKVT